MKVISIGTDRKLFDENSSVRQRQIEYAKFFSEHHLIVFTPDNQHFQDQKLAENIFLHPTRSKIKIFYIFDFFKIIRKLIENWKLKIGNSRNNVIISVQDPFETGIVGVLAKLLYGLPLHVQVHTDFAHKYFHSMSVLNLIRFYLAEFVIKYADRVRVVSERIKGSVEEFNENMDVLPIQVKFKDLKIERLKDWQKKEGKNILTICRLEKEKNIETAIKAFKIVSEKFPEAIFTVVGDGKEMDKLKNLSRIMNLESRIRLVGWQNDLSEYYQNADIYISTSLYEGYGLSMIEAAASDLPIVASDTGIADDSFASVCDAKDPNCFAEKLTELLENPDLRKTMGNKARNFAENHLNNQGNYFKNYADSVLKTTNNFKKINILRRIFDFKVTLWRSVIYIRYFICGITGAAVNIGSLYVFTDIVGIWYLYSSVFAFIIGLVVSFTLQKFVVFKDHTIDNLHHQFSKYLVAAVLGVITNTTLIFFFTDIVGFWYVVSQLFAGFFVMIQNFLLYKFFIFKK